MRARPKILLAENYEKAEELYNKYSHCLLSVLADTRFPRSGKINSRAGIDFLSMIKKEMPNISLLGLSEEEENRAKIKEIPAAFLNKNSERLDKSIRDFFRNVLVSGILFLETGTGKNLQKLPIC